MGGPPDGETSNTLRCCSITKLRIMIHGCIKDLQKKKDCIYKTHAGSIEIRSIT